MRRSIEWVLSLLPVRWYAGYKKTTVDLPDELVRAVKVRAAAQRRSVKDLVAEYLRAGLGLTDQLVNPPPSSGFIGTGKYGLPAVKCRLDAPASRMTVEELLRLEQQSQIEEDHSRVGPL